MLTTLTRTRLARRSPWSPEGLLPSPLSSPQAPKICLRRRRSCSDSQQNVPPIPYTSITRHLTRTFISATTQSSMHSSLQLCPYHFPSASHSVPTLDGLPVQEPNPHEGRTRHCKIISQLCTITSQHSSLAEFPLPSAASVVLRGTVPCIRTSVELSSQHTFFRLCLPTLCIPSLPSSPIALRDESDSLPPPLLLAYILFFFYCTDFQQLHFLSNVHFTFIVHNFAFIYRTLSPPCHTCPSSSRQCCNISASCRLVTPSAAI